MGLSFFDTGDVPYSGYLSPAACDVLVVYEGFEALYNVGGYPGFHSGTGIATILHHGVSTTEQLQYDLATMRRLGAQYVYVTDSNGYLVSPTYFFQENWDIGQSALPQTWVGNMGNMPQEGQRQIPFGDFT